MFNLSSRKIKRITSTTILIIFFTWLFYYFLNHIADFKKITLLKKSELGLLVVVYILLLFINGIIIKLIVNKLGGRINTSDGFLLSIFGSFFNLITPFKGGVGFRAFYLKKRNNFDYTKFIASFAGNFIILCLVATLIVMVTSWYLFIKYRIFNFIVFFSFLVLFIVLLFLIIYSPKSRYTKNWFFRKFFEVVEGWCLLKNDLNLVFLLFLLNTLFVFSGVALMQISFWSIGVRVDLIQVLYLYSVSILTFFISITPASLGVYEGMLIITSKIVNISASDALIMAIIIRSVSFATLFLLAGVGSVYYYKKIYCKI